MLRTSGKCAVDLRCITASGIHTSRRPTIRMDGCRHSSLSFTTRLRRPQQEPAQETVSQEQGIGATELSSTLRTLQTAQQRLTADPSRIATMEYVIDVSKRDFAPRFGLAWDPFGKGLTSIRTGYGIYHEQVLSGHFPSGHRVESALSGNCNGEAGARSPRRRSRTATDADRDELAAAHPPVGGLVVDVEAACGFLQVHRSSPVRRSAHRRVSAGTDELVDALGDVHVPADRDDTGQARVEVTDRGAVDGEVQDRAVGLAPVDAEVVVVELARREPVEVRPFARGVDRVDELLDGCVRSGIPARGRRCRRWPR